MKEPSSAQDGTPASGKLLAVVLPPALHEALEMQAADEGLDLATLARRSIRLHLRDLAAAATTTGGTR